LHRGHFAPRALAFAEASAALTPAVQALCNAAPAPRPTAALEHARARWRDSLVAWEALSAVQVGPLVERRSARRIDFQPPRPELIERAVRSTAATGLPDGAALERVGAPAKGLPALEWLLWTRSASPGSAECRYAQALAADVALEAQALAQGFEALAAREWEGEEAAAAFGEFVNQWVGGIDRLRWAGLEKPARSANGKRAASDSSALAWRAQWQALQALSRGPALPIGEGLVTVEGYLRGRGLNPLADALAARVAQAGQAVERLGNSAAPATSAAQIALDRDQALADRQRRPGD
jgi:predicted lipoprotein